MIGDIVYLGGELLEKNKAFISPFDRGFQYGDSVYEVVPIVGGLPRSFDAAWRRLTFSAASLSININLSKKSLAHIFAELIQLNNVGSGYVYLQISRGISELRHRVEDSNANTIFIYTNSHDLIKKIKSRKPLNVITCEESRWSGREIKCTNLIPNVLAKEMAYLEGADEAIFVSYGQVNEGASSSVFLVKNGILYSRTSDSDVLNGIRSDLINEIAGCLKYKIVDCVFSVDDLLMADEIFLTSATLGVAAVGKVDNVIINGGIIGPHTKIFRNELIDRLSR